MSVIFVSGTARSGTSLTTEVLRACGAEFGNVNSMGEHLLARETVLKVYLQKCGADPLGQDPLPEYHQLVEDEGFANDLMYALYPAYFYKDPKLLLIWPTVRRHFPDAHWILCRRDLGSIAQSCMKAKFMTRYTLFTEWVNWAEEYADRAEDLKESDANYTEYYPGECVAAAIHDDFTGFKGVVEQCGLVWDEDAVRKVVRPQEWHN